MRPRDGGIEPVFEDALGTRRTVSPDVQAAVLAAMGDEHDAGPSGVVIARRGEALERGGAVTLEDGSSLGAITAIPPDLPFGYHRLDVGDAERLLIVGPGRCHLPPGLRAWGWAAQLYAARSRESWGIGDLADLRRLSAYAGSRGARYVVVNPLLAATPGVPQERSPYSPSSRRFRNPVYLRIEDVPGAELVGPEIERLAAEGRALNTERLIDRDAVFRLKMTALEKIWSALGGASSRRHASDLEAFRWAHGRAIRDWATFCALAERARGGWTAWPEELRHPDGPAVREFERAHRDRIAFHEWLQWLLDRQASVAAREIGVVNDMPVGVDPGGADAWGWQDLLATGASIGAPPDRFNAAGQDWGLAPFVPDRLQAARYEPFIQTLRASLRHAAGLRIDHVMGLFRLWWIPGGRDAASGAYVRYPHPELLEIVALESHRAGAIVVGEDLGTVEPGVRDELAARGMLSYRLVYFEPDGPSRFPELALAAVTTHDLPTIAGAWSGSDLDDQRRSGLEPDEPGLATLRQRLAEVTGLPTGADAREVIERVHAALARSPSAIVTLTLDDALAVEERPNLPGTVDSRPNWSLALPVPLEALERDAFVDRLVDAVRAGRRARPAQARGGPSPPRRTTEPVGG